MPKQKRSSVDSSMICIGEQQYSVIDAKERMTVPDCFVLKNKIGCGHGEAKFYVGQKTDEQTLAFFDDFSRLCFFLKSDLSKYLDETEVEYRAPQQMYKKKLEMPGDWVKYKQELSGFSGEILSFGVSHQKHLVGPRVYINSDDAIYTFIRKISLPNVTYLSALKLQDATGKISYYFKLFLDYFGQEHHPSIADREVEKVRDDSKIAPVEKEQVIKARVGQGAYREALLAECPFCPITQVTDDRLLIASHIKPWVDSTRKEKIDPKNGFMFTPTFDFLFDRGFITFKDDAIMDVSPWISKMTMSKLGIVPGKKYPMLPIKGREGYLDYHRKNIFKK